MPESEIHRLVRHAIDLGINHFDTAVPASYGDSELILGRALADVPRDRYTLSTKFGIVDEASGEAISPERTPTRHNPSAAFSLPPPFPNWAGWTNPPVPGD